MNGVTAGGAFGTFAGGALVAYCYMQRDRPCEKQPKESTDNQIMEKGIVVGEERVTRDIRAQEAAAAFDVLTG